MTGIIFWLSVGGIIYAYIGYPLCLTLLARLKVQPRPYPESEPTVTLLIAAYNEESVIASKLENSLALDYPSDRLQILVAADGSDDHTVAIVQSFADKGIELSFSPQRSGKMAAITRAMKHVRGDIIVFSDANNRYQTDTIRQLIAPFTDQTVGGVSGAKTIIKGDGVLGDSEGLYWKYESFIKKQETKLGCCVGVAGEIFAIRRVLFSTPPDNVINDDFYMAMDLVCKGYSIIYVPTAHSYERISLSAEDEIVRRSRIIAGRYQAIARSLQFLPFSRPLLVWQIVSHKFLRPLVPFAMVSALVANLLAVVLPGQDISPLLTLASPYNWILLMFQLLFYGCALIAKKWHPNGWAGKLLYLPVFLINSNYAALLGFYRYISKSQTPIWKKIKRRGEVENA